MSDYRMTGESFDTIALHVAELHDALLDQWGNEVDKSDVKLSPDQKFLCKAQGVPLPFLPVVTIEERKKFARCVLDPSFPKCNDAAAIF